MIRPLGWLVHRIGLRTLFAFTLLLLAVSTVAIALGINIRGLDVELTLTIAVLGLLLGWVVAALPLRGWLALILVIGFGIQIILLRVGQIGGKILDVVRALVEFAPGISLAPLHMPKAAPIFLALQQFFEGVNTLLVRLRDWLLAMQSGAPAFDPVATALVWSTVLWFIAAWVGWSVRRREKAFEAMAPALALLVILLAYAQTNLYFLLLLLAVTLLLLALIAHSAHEHHWRVSGIDYSEDIRADITAAVLVVSMLLLVLAALTPSLSVREIVRFFQQLNHGQVVATSPLPDSLGLPARPVPTTVFDALRSPGLPRSHLLGSGPELSKQIVMTIHTNELLPGPPLEFSNAPPPPRYYWRSATYEQYNGRGWFGGGTYTVDYKAGDSALAENLPAHRVVNQDVQTVSEVGGVLYAAGTLVTVDHDYGVAWRAQDDVFGANVDANSYRAESLVPNMTEDELRAAGSNYPQWVGDRYLALPENVPARVLALARDLTATEPTPYDRARAIEKYLRTFPYTLDLPAPPPNRDVVEYFLFDLKKGYCDYYASAMVVLARAAGVPARLAVGYASGSYDPFNAHYVVTAADAHSWVEVYFPTYGWIEFEPTAAIAEINRGAQNSAAPIAPPDSSSSGIASRAPLVNWWLVLPVGFGILALVGLAALASESWRLRHATPPRAVNAIYARVYSAAARLYIPRAGDTPYELAASLSAQMQRWSNARALGKLITPAAEEVRALTDLYVQSIYGSRAPSETDHARAIKLWERLRWRLWLARGIQSARRKSKTPQKQTMKA